MSVCTSKLKKKKNQISLLDQNYIFLYQDTTAKGISHFRSLVLLLKLWALKRNVCTTEQNDHFSEKCMFHPTSNSPSEKYIASFNF